MRPGALPPIVVRLIRQAARYLRRHRRVIAIGVYVAVLVEHTLLPELPWLLLAAVIVGLPIAVLAMAGRLHSAEIAAHYVPTHPEVKEGIVRTLGALTVVLVLPAWSGAEPIAFALVAALAIAGVTKGGDRYGLQAQDLEGVRAAAQEIGLEPLAVERLWGLVTSYAARGARFHSVGLKRALRELEVEKPEADRTSPTALRGRVAGWNWILLDRRWMVPAVRSTHVSAGGVSVRVSLLPGQTVEDVRAVQDRLAAVFGVQEVVALRTLSSPRGDEVMIEFRLRDPLERPTPYPFDAESTVNGVQFGVTESGEPRTLPMLESSLLLGGLPGSGKSVALHVLLAGLAGLENVAIIGVDPKRGAELGVWRPRLTALSNGDDLEDLLAALVAEMNRRLDVLAEVGEPKVTEVDLPTFPLIVLVLDELAELLAGGITRDERARDGRVASLLRLLVAKGRAAAIVPVLATQKPASDTIPTAIRDLIRERVAFATSTVEMTETIVGSGSASRAPAHEIRHDLPGLCFLLAESDREPVRARAYWLDRDEACRIAEATAYLRVGIAGIGDGRVGVERSFE